MLTVWEVKYSRLNVISYQLVQLTFARLDLTWLVLTCLVLSWLDLTWLDLTWLVFSCLDLTWLGIILIRFVPFAGFLLFRQPSIESGGSSPHHIFYFCLGSLLRLPFLIFLLCRPGIVKHIDGLNTEQIQKIGIPNGIPLVYKFDRNMKPIVQPKAVFPLSGEYLEKKVNRTELKLIWLISTQLYYTILYYTKPN